MKRSIGRFAAASVFSAMLMASTSALAQTPAKPAPVKATLDSGVIVGETQDGVNYFRGVPFARPPVGALRWKAPQKPDTWSVERAAVAWEPPCPQPTNPDGKTTNGGGVAGVTSEDCLYLNVYAPPNVKNAPVVLLKNARIASSSPIQASVTYRKPSVAAEGIAPSCCMQACAASVHSACAAWANLNGEVIAVDKQRAARLPADSNVWSFFQCPWMSTILCETQSLGAA